MKPDFIKENIELYLGDSLSVLPQLPYASVDSIVSDPPYEIGMRDWDATGIACDVPQGKPCGFLHSTN